MIIGFIGGFDTCLIEAGGIQIGIAVGLVVFGVIFGKLNRFRIY